MFVGVESGAGTEAEERMSRMPDTQNTNGGTNGAQGAPAAPGAGAGAANGVRDSLVGKIVCPFCGQQKSASSEPCPRCTMEDTPATRQATKARIGPWYVLQNRSPSAPGMKYATLLWLVNKGHVTPRSVVRGPTTYQLWRYAAHVRGLSREFGLCYSCGSAVQKSDHACAQCERPQDPPLDPDVLLDVRDATGGPRAPVMREIDPPRDAAGPRAAAEARRTPPPPVVAPPVLPPPPEVVREEYEDEDQSDADEQDERREDEALEEEVAAVGAAEASHGERLRAHHEVIVRPKPHQDLARRAGGRTVSATNLAAALQDPDDDVAAPRTRRWSALNVVLFILLLAAGAAAALLYFKPEYREPTARWTRATWSSVREKLESMQWSSPPGEPPAPRIASRPVTQAQPQPQLQSHANRSQQAVAPPPQTQPAHVAVNPPGRDPQRQTQTQGTTQPSTPPLQVAKNDPPKDESRSALRVEPKDLAKEEPKREPPSRQPQLARDTTAPQPKSQERKDPPQTSQRKPDERTASGRRNGENESADAQPKQQSPPPPPTNTNAEPVSLEQAMDESRKLRNQGIDAEARNDYAAALQFYEQIRKIRRDAWPSDLQIRIDLARKQVKARSAKSE